MPDRGGRRGGDPPLLHQVGDLLVHDHEQQFGLGGGVAEDRAIGDVGGGSDLLGGGARIALRGEQRRGGFGDAATLLGLVALTTAQESRG